MASKSRNTNAVVRSETFIKAQMGTLRAYSCEFLLWLQQNKGLDENAARYYLTVNNIADASSEDLDFVDCLASEDLAAFEKRLSPDEVLSDVLEFGRELAAADPCALYNEYLDVRWKVSELRTCDEVVSSHQRKLDTLEVNMARIDRAQGDDCGTPSAALKKLLLEDDEIDFDPRLTHKEKVWVKERIERAMRLVEEAAHRYMLKCKERHQHPEPTAQTRLRVLTFPIQSQKMHVHDERYYDVVKEAVLPINATTMREAFIRIGSKRASGTFCGLTLSKMPKSRPLSHRSREASPVAERQ